MSDRSGEFRRLLCTVGVAACALLSVFPFLFHLVLSPVFSARTRRRIRSLLASQEPVPADVPPDGLAGRTYYFLAGEDSGDAHAAHLIEALRQRDPDCVIRGMGGPLMAAAGCRLDHDLVRMNVMGLLPVLRSIGTFFGLYRRLLRMLDREPPDVLVPVDYPGFNLRVARAARRRNVKVAYYIAPQVWAWAPWRLGKIARSVDRMLAILPFERELYSGAGIPCAFVGHPLFEHLATGSPRSADGRIGLLPGSRRSEVRGILPWMLDAARRTHSTDPETRFVISYRSERLEPVIREILAEEGSDLRIDLVQGRTHEVMRDLSAALVASGTATLELACFGVPMVVMYRIRRLASPFKRLFLLVPHVALVNIVAGRRVVPEYVQAGNPASAASATIGEWRAHPAARERVEEDLAAVRSKLASKGVADRAAGWVQATG